jgi:hypothetical protein
MNTQDYPALYRSSDSLSQRYQLFFLRLMYWHLAALVVAATISVFAHDNVWGSFALVIVLLAGLGFSLYLLLERPDKYWYSARAVAESIKTATWRFVCRAEPFDGTLEEDRSRFRDRLRLIVEQNVEVAKRLTEFLSGDQITPGMLSIRERTLAQRIALYRDSRIVDQRSWYADKAAYNRRMLRRYLVALIITYSAAILCAVGKTAFATFSPWPTDVFIALGLGFVAWINAKRFSELASSYSLAAHEIGLAKDQLDTVKGETEFSHFVGDTENAFSREHTQWVARKDE